MRRCKEQSRSPRWNGVALAVAEHLDLDVARLGEILLDVDAVVAERGLGLGGACLQAPCRFRPRAGATFMPRRRRLPPP
jgi:hypothetical protein